jgi:methionyl-tRNA synthetase
MKPIISFDDFAKLDLRVGKVISCEPKEGSTKLLRLTVDFGEEGHKKIFSGIAQWYTPEDLIGKSFIFIINLEPRKMMDEYSEGMLLAADGEKPLPLTTSEQAIPGAAIR